MNIIELFTDGGISRYRGDVYGASVFLIRDVKNKKQFIYSTYYNNTVLDSNLTELLSIRNGLVQIDNLFNSKDVVVRVISDSQYSLFNIDNFLTLKLKYGKSLNPRIKIKGKKIKFFYMLRKISFLLDRFNSYKFIKVKSHIRKKEISKSYNKFILNNMVPINIEEYRSYIKFNNICDLKVKECLNKLKESDKEK